MNGSDRSSAGRSAGAWAAGLTLLACCWLPVGTAAQTLIVRVEGLRSTDGSIRVGFYDSPEQWATKKSSFQRAGAKREHLLGDGTVVLTFTDVPPGHYAVAIADDENDNGEIDWGFLLPKEGFGFSDYYSTRLRRPDFEEFDFVLPEGETVQVVVRVRYL